MATFTAGKRLTAQLLNNAFTSVADNVQLTAGTTTSTSYVTALTGGTTCGTSFVAPASGKVVILFYGRLRSALAANITLLSIRVTDGAVVDSGTEILAAADNNAIQHTGTADEGASAHHLLSGLTPGASYSVVLRHRVNGSTGTFTSRKVTVIGLPA